MLAEIPVEQVVDAVEGVAGELLAEAEIAGPPVDARLLARRLGLTVLRGAAMAERARFVRVTDGGGPETATILVAEEDRPERRQWAVAHEIAEASVQRLFERLGVDP